MSVSRRWTVADLEQMELKETERYEIIDGELIVTHAPSWEHSYVCSQLTRSIENWSDETQRGTTLQVPGVIFSPADAVIPDLVWTSWDRLRHGRDRAGHFTIAPELVIEVISPGASNERRDRQTKLDLYSREHVEEYWIVDWQRRTVDIYRQVGGALALIGTLVGDDVVETPLLPGFSVPIARLWPPAL
jgi:Uma2 family endonuclease